MCRTPYCYGDCEDCIADDKEREEYEEMSKSCPQRKECKLSTINIKLDQCIYCGKTFDY